MASKRSSPEPAAIENSSATTTTTPNPSSAQEDADMPGAPPTTLLAGIAQRLSAIPRAGHSMVTSAYSYVTGCQESVGGIGGSAMRKATLAEHRLLRRIPFFESELGEELAASVEKRRAALAKQLSKTGGSLPDPPAASTMKTMEIQMLERRRAAEGGDQQQEQQLEGEGQAIRVPSVDELREIDEILDADDDKAPPPEMRPTNINDNAFVVPPGYRGRARTQLVHLDDSQFINTFIMDNQGNIDDLSQPARKTMVVCHGFGAGVGFWYKNFVGFAAVPGLRVFGIDWMGMGRSSRHISLPKRTAAVGHEDDVEQVETFFAESLEQWRIKCNIDKMTLIGHSFGGYMSMVYALKYPERVEKLILASPVGIPPAPKDNPFLRNATPTQKRLIGVASGLWSMNVTPQSIVRAIGPLSHSLVRGYCTRRFPYLSAEDMEDLISYLHAVTTLPGTGEFALSRVLAPGAFPHRPLAERLHLLKMPVVFLCTKLMVKVELSFMTVCVDGEVDWMNPAVPIEKVRNKELAPGSKLIIIPNAGHQLFLDNWQFFNRCLINEL